MKKQIAKNKKAKNKNRNLPDVRRNYLSRIEIEASEKGFCVWVKERKMIGGKMQMFKHWVIDGSMLKETGVISMGELDMYKIEARYQAKDNTIIVGMK